MPIRNSLNNTNLTDSEITRLCAEAMEITGWLTVDDPMVTDGKGDFIEPYDPLHNDAQAMALVKKLRMNIAFEYEFHKWSAWVDWPAEVWNVDLNRAICECAANGRSASDRITQEQLAAIRAMVPQDKFVATAAFCPVDDECKETPICPWPCKKLKGMWTP